MNQYCFNFHEFCAVICRLLSVHEGGIYCSILSNILNAYTHIYINIHLHIYRIHIIHNIHNIHLFQQIHIYTYTCAHAYPYSYIMYMDIPQIKPIIQISFGGHAGSREKLQILPVDLQVVDERDVPKVFHNLSASLISKCIDLANFSFNRASNCALARRK